MEWHTPLIGPSGVIRCQIVLLWMALWTVCRWFFNIRRLLGTRIKVWQRIGKLFFPVLILIWLDLFILQL